MSNPTQRAKPGRKPIEDKKQPITIYINESLISDIGGKDAVRGLLLRAVCNIKTKSKK